MRPGEVEGDAGELPLEAGVKVTQFKAGTASLLHNEDVVPALAGAGMPDH